MLGMGMTGAARIRSLPLFAWCSNRLSHTPAGMIDFRPIADEDPALEHSPLLRAAMLTFGYIDENGPIDLTGSGALKRYFVDWAAEAFAWPHYGAADLFAVSKVLNEVDFPPLMILHEVLITAKLARHYKGALRLTRLASALRTQRGELWRLLAQHLLYALNDARYTGFSDRLMGNWDIFLNVLNVEAQTGVSEKRFHTVLFGANRGKDYRLTSMIYVQILQPLCWAGLLDEHRHGAPYPVERLYTKTPLWRAALALETDAILRAPSRH